MRAVTVALAVAAAVLPLADSIPPPPPAQFNVADITSMSQFRTMDDAQLEAVYAAGTAIMPSQEPPYNATGQPVYDFCVGRTYMNAFSPNSSIARSVWPTGKDNPFNNIYERIWWGKVFYNDGTNPKYTQAWNLMGSNKTVGFTALAYINATSPYGDGKPSVLMDFSQMEDRLVRPFVDEIRYINNGIWLGQSYVYNEWSVQAKEGKGKGDKVNQGMIAAVASTLTDVLQWAGVSQTGNDNVPSAQGFYLMGYFALQCVGPKTPKLRYSALAYYDALQGVKRHFLPADYQLPALPTAPDEGAIAGPGFPAASESAEGDFPKLHMWPYRRSDVRIGANITQMKPFKGEFIHGERALYPIAAQGMQDWRDANRSYLGWTPTDAQRAAIKDIESNKLLELAEAFDAKAQYAGEAYPVYPGAPTDDTLPYLAPPVTDWAIHAIVAANEAVKAARDNGIKGNPIAQLISEVKYGAQLKAAIVADAGSAAFSSIVGPKDPWINATFVDGLKEIKRTLSLNRSAVTLKPGTEIRAALDMKAVVNATQHLAPYKPNITVVPFNLTRFKAEIKNAATPEKLAVKTNAENRPVPASRLGLAPPGPLFG